MKSKISRRKFVQRTSLAGAGFCILPSHTISGLGHQSPSDKLHIAGVGIGGKGRWNLGAMNSEHIVALCDVDQQYSQQVFEEYPGAKRYKDWRLMLDEMDNTIDAVMIATPDHTH